MNPPMYQRVRNMFGDAGLTTGFLVQLLNFNDPNDLSKAIMVFRPNGGTPIRNDLGNDNYVLVDVIGAKDKTRRRQRQLSQSLITFRQILTQTNAWARSKTWALTQLR